MVHEDASQHLDLMTRRVTDPLGYETIDDGLQMRLAYFFDRHVANDGKVGPGVIVSRLSLSGELGISRGSAPLSVDLSESHIAAQTGVLVVLGESIKTLFFRLKIPYRLIELFPIFCPPYRDPRDVRAPAIAGELINRSVPIREPHRSFTPYSRLWKNTARPNTCTCLKSWWVKNNGSYLLFSGLRITPFGVR